MNSSRPGRLGVGVVGAGRVGAVLGNALRASGHAVVGASGVSAASRDRIEMLLPGVPVLEVQQVVERSELVLLAVPDDALTELVSGLAALGAWQPGQLVVHTSGRYGTAVLGPAAAVGAIPLAIHPAMTFTGTSLDLTRLVGCPFAVTAPGPVLPIGEALVVEIGGEPVVLRESARPTYHAALAHASNHLVTLVGQAERLLAGAGVEDPGYLLAPLVGASLDGVVRSGEAALTGPVSRGDVGTVAAHLEVLGRLAAEDPGLVDVPRTYRALARATTQRALVAGRIGEGAAQQLLDVLADDGGRPADAVGPLAASGASSTATRAPASPRDLPAPVTSVARTTAELRAARADMPGDVAVVMTMGALHDGHVALVRAARREARHVVVTVFVNPLQFGDAADLASYPRTLDDDVAALRALGPDAPDLVFAPSADEMYPGGTPRVTVSAGPVGAAYEGASRPGHFDGMLTVVLKLLHLVQPAVAMFGQKDAQQLALVRAMVGDLDVPTRVVAVPTVREADGLALSSRNARLDAGARDAALALSAALRAGRVRAEAGDDAGAVLAAAQDVLDGADPRVAVDYLALVDPARMVPVDVDATGQVVLLVAAVVDGVRLIDNTPLELHP
ncbi:pantoate/beta-alanine ligase [Beutenbergia cavernae DSM 12333]|uniref:Pantothenate synthetase n=1 Tax=Beutenbergia cavernae (strain ATCC BAA-8 / DSM 12333 / CCUG 43141 / JCM 11478 / NBRC 16432 / NCIMB 13614 / HKI 0122) TaxID=471853 RepID=C5BYL9_BEUC1|nr:pantoate/beta-alanine ligase [Beutenbergia cavernae DSM 12333]